MTINDLATPCYVIDKSKLIANLECLKSVSEMSGCHILLAQKAFSMFILYPLIGKYLNGTTASGLYEARLGYEEMVKPFASQPIVKQSQSGFACQSVTKQTQSNFTDQHIIKENHVFAPAYKTEDMKELIKICDHISFNSFSQYEKHRALCQNSNISVGIRVNPEFSTQGDHAIYDPCAAGSRLGVTKSQFREDLLDGIEGLHFHTLCEQNADDLVNTFHAFEDKFGEYLKNMKWLNLGGGHHITRADYQIDSLINLIKYIRDKYQVTVYLEPGEAVALNAGYLVTEVLDIVHNGIDILILDASAACHMPDVLEMPYRPPLKDGYKSNEKPYNYRLSSMTCLAGDIIGDYSFEKPIQIGDRLLFEDMAIYTMVKNNTFNGIPLPSIAVLESDNTVKLIKKFGYKDFKERLS